MPDTTSVKAKVINLIRSVRTVARSMLSELPSPCPHMIYDLEMIRLWKLLIRDTVPLIAVNALIITYEMILG